MTFGRAMPSADLEGEVALVGAGIAAVSSVVLLASLFVAWYRFPAQTARSGWTALGAVRYVLVVAACAGVLPSLARRWTRPACLIASFAGLGAALLVVFRVAVVPDAIPGNVHARLAGVFIALIGAGGIAGGSALAGIGPSFFASPRHAVGLLSTIAAGGVVVAASLFMPWEWRRYEVGPASGVSAWHAAPTGAVLLLLGAVAIVLASSLVAVIRWRCSFFALAVGGWVAAALAAVSTPLAAAAAGEVPNVHRLAGYAPGYYVCLAAAGAIALAGICGAVDAVAGTEHRAPQRACQ
jgi:hypothetical protein